MCWKLPSTLRLWRLALARVAVAARLTTMPARATTRISVASTSGGEMSRRTASIAMIAASTSRVMPLAWAERISARLRPKVIWPSAGRWARLMATSEKPIAAASVSMCAASESSARELARIPVTTSAAMKARISARAIASLPRSAPALAPCVWPAWE